MKRLVIILAGVLFLFGAYFVFSILMYQHLVNDGSVLADNQCLKVNPHIIERKNSYIKSMQALKDNDPNAYEKETENYLSTSRKYVTEQTSWLDTQKKYMSRWDFQYFTPSYMKEAAQHQYNSRKADTESTTFLIEAFEIAPLNTSIAEELSEKSMEKIKVRNEAEKKYDELWDNPGELDWRTRFIKVPDTKCPDENFNFPDVEEFLNPSIQPGNADSPLS
jgi:hypothetical protein